MNQAEFIDVIRQVVVESAAGDVLAQLAKPSGRRRLSEGEERRAAWFNALSAEERAHVEYVAADAARVVAFGLFCVLDGAKAIEDGLDRGHLELRYLKAESNVLLASSDMSAPFLHELF